MSSSIPEGWTEVKLGQIVKLQGGNAFKSSDFKEKGIPIVRISNIQNNLVDLSSAVYCEETKHFENFLISNGDILLAMSGATTGKIGRYRYPFKSYLNQRVGKFKIIKNNLIDYDFLNHLVNSNIFTKNTMIDAIGGAQPNISSEQVEGVFYVIPPLPEQKKIASILTSVDEVIETTQKQIDKLQDLKKATMNELLTKGIGHTEFKNSELGKIPKIWEAVRLGEIGKWQGGGTPSKLKLEFWDGNIPWVSPKDMKYEYISQTEDSVSESAVANSSTNLIDAGAILVVVRSGILKHTLPVAISKCDLTINQDMKALSVSRNFSNLFIYHYLVAKNHLVLRSTLKAGNTVESIDTQVFSEYLIPSPPLHEQIEIANIVENIASQIRKMKQKLAQTHFLKKSLMQDLLTGNVRVKVN